MSHDGCAGHVVQSATVHAWFVPDAGLELRLADVIQPMIEPFGHGGRLHVADAVGAVELGELVLQPVFGQCACASETGYAVVPAGQRVGYRRICPESLWRGRYAIRAARSASMSIDSFCRRPSRPV